MNEILLNKSELSKAIRRSRGYVTAMIDGGYNMKYASLTTAEHALDWLYENQGFKRTDYFCRRGLLGKSPSRKQRGVGKYDARRNSRGQ